MFPDLPYMMLSGVTDMNQLFVVLTCRFIRIIHNGAASIFFYTLHKAEQNN